MAAATAPAPAFLPITQKPGLRITQAQIDKATKGLYYIGIGGDKLAKRHASGMRRMWGKPGHEGDLYSMDYRLAGTSENMQSALRAVGFTDKQVEDIINRAVGSDNIADPAVARAVDDEIATYRRTKKKPESKSPYTLEMIPTIIDALSRSQSTTGGGVPGVRSPGGTRSRPLTERIVLPDNRVVDVSSMIDPASGKGIKNIVPTTKGNMMLIPSNVDVGFTDDNYYRIVTSSAKDPGNVKYVEALRYLGVPEETIALAVANLRPPGGIAVAPAPRPTAFPSTYTGPSRSTIGTPLTGVATGGAPPAVGIPPSATAGIRRIVPGGTRLAPLAPITTQPTV